MAFLMLLHEKMRLQRKINKLTLKQLHMGNIQERMQRKIDKREKYYSKLEKQLERQANCYKNSMNMSISNMFGLGANSVNMYSPYGSNGAMQQVLSRMNLDDMNKMLGLDGTANGPFQLNQEVADAIKSGTLQVNNSSQPLKWGTGDNIKEIPAGAVYNGYTGDVLGGVDAQKVGQAYQQLQQYAQIQVSQMQTQASNMKAAYENNVSIWLEAQQEQLEAQKEWEMDLLTEEQEDMEAEKTSVEAQLELAKQRKEAIEQELGNSIKDSAPKFGLG